MTNRGRGTGGASSSSAPRVEDPRVDGVLKALKQIGELLNRRAHKRAATTASQAEERVATAAQAAQAAAAVVHAAPGFNEKGDPELAPRRIAKMEKCFRVIGCTETEKVTPATYRLQDLTHDWWMATSSIVFPEGVGRMWATFAQVFNNKYFSVAARERKMREFRDLRQGNMTIEQYEIEFTGLAKYAPRMVENPEDNAMRFRDGLQPELRSRLIALNPNTYE
ncbi:uncharacterized protein LOC125316461 [Rhodamnia argentea]|uniref:Uncharacterized protein LOC125316461 n=1 Tax=Rhodamnia argentea TaxID=178133 RepID=A0ABM3HVY6_9MYRT|nr:uncharacterized protein LOC125316461 [Rhodamnia argentea]